MPPPSPPRPPIVPQLPPSPPERQAAKSAARAITENITAKAPSFAAPPKVDPALKKKKSPKLPKSTPPQPAKVTPAPAQEKKRPRASVVTIHGRTAPDDDDDIEEDVIITEASVPSASVDGDTPADHLGIQEDDEAFVEVSVDTPSQTWVCCDACTKWRTVPSNFTTGSTWTCAEHPDPAWRSCSIPEEDCTDLVNLYTCSKCGAEFATPQDVHLTGDVRCDNCEEVDPAAKKQKRGPKGPRKRRTASSKDGSYFSSHDRAISSLITKFFHNLPDDAKPVFTSPTNPRAHMHSEGGIKSKKAYDEYSKLGTIGQIRQTTHTRHFVYDLKRGWAFVTDHNDVIIPLPPKPKRIPKPSSQDQNKSLPPPQVTL